MVILYRHISPTTGFQADISQHLTFGKRNIPSIIPRQRKISGFLRQFCIVCTFFSFGNQSQIISSCSSIQGGFLVLAIGIQRRREIIGFRYQFLLQIVHRTLGACQITLVLEILGCHHQRQCCRRRATTAGIHNREIILELTRETAVLIL